MFCEKCGNKIDGSQKFCNKCGNPTDQIEKKNPRIETPMTTLNEKWWQRFLKVLYIISYIPLPFVLFIVWSMNSSSYDYSTYYSTDTSGTAFLYTVLALLSYIVIIRLIKIAVLYVAMGRKPEWKKEFKKIF